MRIGSATILTGEDHRKALEGEKRAKKQGTSLAVTEKEEKQLDAYEKYQRLAFESEWLNRMSRGENQYAAADRLEFLRLEEPTNATRHRRIRAEMWAIERVLGANA